MVYRVIYNGFNWFNYGIKGGAIAIKQAFSGLFLVVWVLVSLFFLFVLAP
jgi:hypothetical protein